MSFLIGSGYFNNHCQVIPAQEMAVAWLACIRKYANPQPARIVIVTAGGCAPKLDGGVDIIKCTGDVGNLSHKNAGLNNHFYAGWAPPMFITAMLAYNECMDFIFQEQDCLAFGPYIQRLYADMGDAGAAIGQGLGGMGQPASQSLFIVRHAYICPFLRDYIGMGPDDNEQNQGEKKFGRMRDNKPGEIKTTTFNVDRDRPIPWDNPVFGFQQPSRAEFEEAKWRFLTP